MPKSKTTTDGATPMQVAETAHTPGPWRLDGNEIIGTPEPHMPTFEGDHRAPSCVVASLAACEFGTYRDYRANRAAANARLIAASPDLLAALEKIIEWDDAGCDPSRESLDKARAAVAKSKEVQS